MITALVGVLTPRGFAGVSGPQAALPAHSQGTTPIPGQPAATLTPLSVQEQPPALLDIQPFAEIVGAAVAALVGTPAPATATSGTVQSTSVAAQRPTQLAVVAPAGSPVPGTTPTAAPAPTLPPDSDVADRRGSNDPRQSAPTSVEPSATVAAPGTAVAPGTAPP